MKNTSLILAFFKSEKINSFWCFVCFVLVNDINVNLMICSSAEMVEVIWTCHSFWWQLLPRHIPAV